MSMIEKKSVIDAQDRWAASIVQIGEAFKTGANYKALAEIMLDSLYAFALGPVLFKPTRAAQKPFRIQRAGALSYFIGNNPDYAEDQGFALEPWSEIKIQNVNIIPTAEHALAMGIYQFTNMHQKTITAEYSFVYIPDSQGQLRIQMHHSSMPFKNNT